MTEHDAVTKREGGKPPGICRYSQLAFADDDHKLGRQVQLWNQGAQAQLSPHQAAVAAVGCLFSLTQR